MTEQELLKQIPDSWMTKIAPEEIQNIFAEIGDKLTQGMAVNLDIHCETHELMEKIQEKVGGTIEELKQELHWYTYREVRIALFKKYYGDQFPKDQKGHLIFTQDIMEKAVGKGKI